MTSSVYCKLYAADGVHFVKVEKEQFTFKWLCETYIRSEQNMHKSLAFAYDDLSGDRVLLSNEGEFQLMLEMMEDIGANMVKLYATIIKKKGLLNKKHNKHQEVLRGGSFGVFNAKRLTGCDKLENAPNSENTISKPLVNAYIAYMSSNHCRPLDVAEINVSCVKDSFEVVCIGKLNHPDFKMNINKHVITHLENEPKKCALIDIEKEETYVLEFLTEKDGMEFCEKVGMMGQKLQEKAQMNA